MLDLFLRYGANAEQFYAVFELDLVKYTDTKWIDPPYGEEEGGWLELSDLGKEFVAKLLKRKAESLAPD